MKVRNFFKWYESSKCYLNDMKVWNVFKLYGNVTKNVMKCYEMCDILCDKGMGICSGEKTS